MFTSGDVIEENHLRIFFSLNLNSLRAVTRLQLRGIYIYHLPISLVTEEKASVRVRVNSEVR